MLRKILCVKKSTNLEAMYGELGLTLLSFQRKIILIKYWYKLIKSDPNSILFKSYKMLQSMVNQGSTNLNNWALQIKQILDHCGMSYTWLHQFDTEINISQITQRINDMYK